MRVLSGRDGVSRVFARGTRGRLPAPVLIDVAIATLAVLLIASPLLFTSDGFAPDFTNDIWLAGYQQHVITAHLHPTLFLQTQQGGVFYPLFAFYGGTLFALTGALAAVLGGSTILAFEVVTLAAIAAAYGGIFWLARQLGVKRSAGPRAGARVRDERLLRHGPLRTGSVGGVHGRLGVAARARGVAAAGAWSLARRAGRSAWWRRAWCSAAATTSRCCGARRSLLWRCSCTGS